MALRRFVPRPGAAGIPFGAIAAGVARQVARHSTRELARGIVETSREAAGQVGEYIRNRYNNLGSSSTPPRSNVSQASQSMRYGAGSSWGRRPNRRFSRLRRRPRRFAGIRKRRTGYGKRKSYRRKRYSKRTRTYKTPWSPVMTVQNQTPHALIGAQNQQKWLTHVQWGQTTLTGFITNTSWYRNMVYGASGTATVVSGSNDYRLNILPTYNKLDLTSSSSAAQHVYVQCFRCIRNTSSSPVTLADNALQTENDWQSGLETDQTITNTLHKDPNSLQASKYFWKQVYYKKLFMNHGQVVSLKYTCRPTLRYFIPRLQTNEVYVKGITFMWVFRVNGTAAHAQGGGATTGSSATRLDVLHYYNQSVRFQSFTEPSYCVYSALGAPTNPVVMNEYGNAADVIIEAS